jgi:hypothetical protein
MSEETPKIDSTHPWPGLANYTEDVWASFFGRDNEVEELLKLLQVEPIALLVSKSGLGKTSLLLAGLFPRLRNTYFLPVYIRFNYFDDATPDEQILSAIRKAASASNLNMAPSLPQRSIYEYLQNAWPQTKSNDERRPTVTLVFDQFEEIFTLGSRSSYAQPLIELLESLTGRPGSLSLAELIADDRAELEIDRPICRVLLSMREDFLADLDKLSLRLPALSYNRFRLGPLKGESALSAISRPASQLLDEETAFTILDAVSAQQFNPANKPPPRQELLHREINPALLSLICTELNETRIRLKQRRITSALVKSNRETILDEFFQQSFKGLKPSIKLFVEDNLVTTTGYRGRSALSEALELTGASKNDFDVLVNRRLIRYYEDTGGATWIELTHDLLVDVVFRCRQERQLDIRRKKTLWKLAGVAIIVSLVILIVSFVKYQNLVTQIKAQKDLLTLQDIQAQIGAISRRQSNSLLRQARESLEQTASNPQAKAFALALLSRALQRDQHNFEAIDLTCQLLLKNTWCPPLTPPLRYASDVSLLCATIGTKESANRVLAVSQDGWLLASEPEDATLTRRQSLLTEQIHPRVAFISAFFSDDGHELLLVPPPLGGIGAVKAQVWRSVDGSYQPQAIIELKDVAPINFAAWSRDGRLLMFIPGRWDRPPIFQAFRLEDARYVDISDQFSGFPTIVASINSKDELVATGSSDGEFQLWKWGANALERVADTPEREGLLALTRPARPFFVAFGPEQDQLIVTAFDQSQQAVAHILSMRPNTPQINVQSPTTKDQFMRFVFSPSDATRRLVATALYSRVALNDISKLDLNNPIAEPINLRGTTGVPVFSLDGKELLTISGSVWIALDTVQLWDVSLRFSAKANAAFHSNNEPAPDWLADLARAVSGIPRTWDDDDGGSPTLSSVQKRARKETVRAPYDEIWQHFFAD